MEYIIANASFFYAECVALRRGFFKGLIGKGLAFRKVTQFATHGACIVM